MARTTEEELKVMQTEVARLQAALGMSEKKRTEAEEMAVAVSKAGQFVSNTEEQASGKTVTIEICLNPWERDTKKQKFKEVEYPTYFYTIDMPRGMGTHLTVNGREFYHGQTYEVDTFALTDLKKMVAQCWYHEKNIHGENENAYRKPLNGAAMSAAAASRQ